MQVSIGDNVKVDHPTTCLNPAEWFTIIDIKFDTFPVKVWVRGKDTCWFNSNMVLGVNHELI